MTRRSRGILAWGTYLPYRRLDRSTIAETAGTGGGKGTRTVASYDEDATTMAVEAGRVALRSAGRDVSPAVLWFATASPPYLDKTNAAAVHAALRLDRASAAYDAIGSVRSAVGALRAAFAGTDTALVMSADIRTGLPGSADEADGGDGAAAFLIGDDRHGPVAAELIGWSSVTEEFLDRWRTPGDLRSKVWEERFGETRYVPLAEEAWRAALKESALSGDDIDRVIVVGMHARATASTIKALGMAAGKVVDPLSATVGNTGAAHPGLLLASALEAADPGETIALVVLADGADVAVFRTTEHVQDAVPGRTVAAQDSCGQPIPYGRYLAWRDLLPVEPPRRPEPARPSASASARSAEWKFGFVGSEAASGDVHVPPMAGDASSRPMADATGTIVTYTIDRLAYSPSPPVVFAVVDFDGGGRLPVELTDVDAAEVAVGDRVEMTFRRLHTADGIHNYFWKARPVR